MKVGSKNLIFDIETSLTIFGAYPQKKPQYLGHHNILKDWFMICAAWQWEDGTKIYSTSLIDDMKSYRKNPYDDYLVVKRLAEVIKEADAIIGHNMAKFDWPKFLARLAYHRLPPVDKPKIVDTYIMAKQFQFSYNSLDYLTKHLGLPKKVDHSDDMWLRIIQGDKKAVEECVLYCKPDVISTKALYTCLKPYVPERFLPNENLYRGKGIDCCPRCGSTEFKKDGFRVTINGKFQSYECLNPECRGHFQDSKCVKRVKMK